MIVIERNGEYLEKDMTEAEFLASNLYLTKGWTLYTGEWPLPVPPVDYTASNYAALWQAAHDYEFSRISGSAIGMLTLGVLQGKPKCSAVASWLKTLWDDNYYPRKALITSEQIDPAQLDFSNVGDIPYPVPELTEEVYGA